MSRLIRESAFFMPPVLVLVGGWSYGFSLRLPLFSDDIPHFVWLHGQDIASIFATSGGFAGYYRPLPFLIWNILWSLQGELHPPILHGVNLALHLLNSVLVWSILRWQTPSRGGLLGTASALLFLLYPFSYQAIPWVGALTHPLVTFLILGSLCLYIAWERRRQRGLLMGSPALALLAPFAHETGILLPLLLALLLVAREGSFRWKEILRRTRFHRLCALKESLDFLRGNLCALIPDLSYSSVFCAYSP